MYYGSKGISLRKETFKKNLCLLTKDGSYNIIAQLLSDNSHLPLRVSIFEGTTKGYEHSNGHNKKSNMD